MGLSQLKVPRGKKSHLAICPANNPEKYKIYLKMHVSLRVRKLRLSIFRQYPFKVQSIAEPSLTLSNRFYMNFAISWRTDWALFPELETYSSTKISLSGYFPLRTLSFSEVWRADHCERDWININVVQSECSTPLQTWVFINYGSCVFVFWV